MSADALRARVQQWAARLRVNPKEIRIQQMTRKWASCSSAGRVTFSLDLIAERRDFQDYVIVHELLHLRWSNHGKLFQSTLKAYLKGNQYLGS